MEDSLILLEHIKIKCTNNIGKTKYVWSFYYNFLEKKSGVFFFFLYNASENEMSYQIICSVCTTGLVVLLFYVHGKHLRSCRDGQLT